MRKRLYEKLYVGDLSDCEGVAPDWYVVHACRNPCYCRRCGDNPDPTTGNYLAHTEGSHLWLNLIDPPVPLFYKASFDAFLNFARQAWKTGRPLLIHCNKGDSRAPSLALLFLAKCLRQLPDSSFDDAWDAFEELAGEKYTPSAGIETWLREHWEEMPQDVEFTAIARSAPKQVDPSLVDDLKTLTNEEAMELVRTQPLVHFAAFAEIEGKNHRWFAPTPNQMQRDISEAYDYCIQNNIPPRLIVLKPRQVGCSTYCAEVCYHHMRRFPSHFLMMGDIASRTEKIWDIFQSIPLHDSFPWDSTITKSNTEKMEFSYADGTDGLVEKGTALDAKSGISGTRQILWFSEAGRYKRLNGHDGKLLAAAVNSVPSAAENSRTLVIMESTAEGADGAYYEHWQKAVTLEERKQGRLGNGFIKVFSPWFSFREHQLKRKPEYAEYFDEQLDERERRGVALYGWTPEQIAWRRMKIPNDCQNDPRVFDQEFPEDATSAFLASGRPRFSVEALNHMELRARAEHDLADVGILEGTDSGVMFRKTVEDSWLWVAEKPTYGRSYIAFTDCCTGEQSEGSSFPDAHSAGILRAAYIDDKGQTVPVKLAAIIDVPNGCRWDPELLASAMKLLTDWYGGPQATVEVTGQGLAVLQEYRRKGIQLYEREKFDDMASGKKTRVVGWDTNSKTRPILVSEIANYIRELALDCTYMPAVHQMRCFVVNDRGKAEAKSGEHDDHVLGLALGLATIELAQPYLPAANQWSSAPKVIPKLAGGLTATAFS